MSYVMSEIPNIRSFHRSGVPVRIFSFFFFFSRGFFLDSRAPRFGVLRPVARLATTMSGGHAANKDIDRARHDKPAVPIRLQRAITTFRPLSARPRLRHLNDQADNCEEDGDAAAACFGSAPLPFRFTKVQQTRLL